MLPSDCAYAFRVYYRRPDSTEHHRSFAAIALLLIHVCADILRNRMATPKMIYSASQHHLNYLKMLDIMKKNALHSITGDR
jgi:hypothetical protein